jgi:hypothetical protein
MANLTDEQREALNNWTRTQPSLRNAFEYTIGQGVPGTAPPSDGLGDRLIAPEPGSDAEVATLQKEVDFTASDSVIYQGFADPGTESSEALWRITRTTFTTNSPNSDDVAVEFASNDTSFVHIWDDRLTLSYGP